MAEAVCKRPPRGTSKEVLRELHKAKMMGKYFRRRDPSYRAGSYHSRFHKGVL